MSRCRIPRLVAIASLSLGVIGGNTTAQDHQHHTMSTDEHAAHRAQAQQAAAKPAETVTLTFPDVALRDADDQPIRFTSDALGDDLVVLDFVYTTCTTVCPVVSAILAQVQQKLGARVGDDVQLLSLTVDPVRDTPARLKRYSAQHGSPQGWRWLTGQPEAVNSVLKAAGTWTPNFEEHPAVILVGDAKTRQWARLYGFASPEDILAKLDELGAARHRAMSQSAAHHH